MGALLVTFVNTGQKEAKGWGGGAMVFLNFVEAEFPEHHLPVPYTYRGLALFKALSWKGPGRGSNN